MRKLFAFALIFAATSASAATTCPSIDKAIADYRNGQGSLIDINDAIACADLSCDLKLAALSNNLEMRILQVDAGAAVGDDIDDAARIYGRAKIECSKN